MDHLFAILFAVALVCVSVTLVLWHVRSWRLMRLELPHAEERSYRWRQFRRRMQASSLIGVLGMAVYLGYLIPARASPGFFLAFWLMVIFVVLWLAALATLDLLATRTFYTNRRSAIEAERLAFAAQVERAEHSRQSGYQAETGRNV